jgi:hypothetical protein
VQHLHQELSTLDPAAIDREVKRIVAEQVIRNLTSEEEMACRT